EGRGGGREGWGRVEGGGKGGGDHDQTLGLFGGVAGALISDIGGGGGAPEQQVLLAVIAGAKLPQVSSEPQPGYATVGRDRHDLPEDLHAAAVVAALEGGIDLAPQRSNGFRRLPRLSLDLGFQFHRRVGEIGAFERLVGGDGGDGQQQDERGCKGSANERAHGGTSIPVGVGKPDGAARSTAKRVEVVAKPRHPSP